MLETGNRKGKTVAVIETAAQVRCGKRGHRAAVEQRTGWTGTCCVYCGAGMAGSETGAGALTGWGSVSRADKLLTGAVVLCALLLCGVSVVCGLWLMAGGAQ